MAGKFLTIEEAARQLGVSVEQVNQFVDRKELFPLRDGATLKFKTDEVSRLAQERADGGGTEQSESLELDLDLDLAGSGTGGAQAGGSGGLTFGDELVFDDAGDAADGSRTLLGGPAAGAAGSSPSLLGAADDAGAISLFDEEQTAAPPAGSAAAAQAAPASSLDDLSLEGIALEAPDEATVDLSGGAGPTGLSRAGSVIGAALSGPLDSGLSLEQNDVAGSGIDLQIGSDIAGPLGTSGIDLGGGSGVGVPGGGSRVGGSGIGGSGIGGGSLVGDAFDLGGGGTDDDSASVVVATESTGDSSFFGTVGDDSSSVSFDESASSSFSQPIDLPTEGEFVIETTFGAWQIMGLVCCTLILLFAGFIMFDLTWTIRAPGSKSFSAPLIEGLASTFGWTK